MSKTRIWGVGAIVLVLVMLIAGWELGISPTLTSVSAANAQAATIQTQNTASQAQLANLQLQFKNLKKLKKSLDTLRESIPENEGASAFLNEVAALCSTTGVSLTSVTLASATLYVDPNAAAAAPPAAGDTANTPAPSASAAPATAAPAAPAAGNGLVLIPVVVIVQGPFDAVRDFMDQAQQGTRLLYSARGELSTGSDGVTTATITGDIFALQGTSDASPAQNLTPIPASTATPTATPTPTPTPKSSTTTSSNHSGSNNTTPTTAPTTPPVTPSPTSTP